MTETTETDVLKEESESMKRKTSMPKSSQQLEKEVEETEEDKSEEKNTSSSIAEIPQMTTPSTFSSSSSSSSSSSTRHTRLSIYSISPPFRFEAIEEGVYRGAYPTMRNFTFLSSLGLRTIISLIPEEPSRDLMTFANLIRARTVWIKVPKYKESVNMDKDTVRLVLEEIISPENLPIYVHCIDGIHVTGLIVMCLRKVEYWSIPSICQEFTRFVPEATTTVSLDEYKFLEAFDGGSRGVLIPKRPPPWLWQGVRITRHPSVKLVSARQRRLETKKELNCTGSNNQSWEDNKNSLSLKRDPKKTSEKKTLENGKNRRRAARNNETLSSSIKSQEITMMNDPSLVFLPRGNVFLVDPLASTDIGSVAYFDTLLCSPRNLKLLASGLYDDDNDDDDDDNDDHDDDNERDNHLPAFNIGNNDGNNDHEGVRNDATLLSLPKYPLIDAENVNFTAARHGEDSTVDKHHHHHHHHLHLDPDPFSPQNFPNLLSDRDGSNSYMPSPYILQLLKKESKNFTATIRALSLDGLTDKASPFGFI